MASGVRIHHSRVVPSTVPAVRDVCQRILSQLRGCNYGPDDIFAVHLALEEASINAIEHGNKKDPNREIKIEYWVTPEKVEISITDQGNGFKPEKVPDPRYGKNLYKTNGRGLLLVRSYMNVVKFNEVGNCVHMVKYKAVEKNDNCL